MSGCREILTGRKHLPSRHMSCHASLLYRFSEKGFTIHRGVWWLKEKQGKNQKTMGNRYVTWLPDNQGTKETSSCLIEGDTRILLYKLWGFLVLDHRKGHNGPFRRSTAIQ